MKIPIQEIPFCVLNQGHGNWKKQVENNFKKISYIKPHIHTWDTKKKIRSLSQLLSWYSHFIMKNGRSTKSSNNFETIKNCKKQT